MLEDSIPTPTPTVREPDDSTRSRAAWALLLVLDALNHMLLIIRSILSGELRVLELHTYIWNAFVAYAISTAQPDKVLADASTECQLENDLDAPSDSSPSDPPEQQILDTSLRALCRAIVRRDIQCVTRILDAAPSLAGTMHNNGWYPIHTAVLTGDLDIVKLIASQPGVDLGKLDSYKYSSTPTAEERCIREEELSPKLKTVKAKNTTVLHYACMTGNMDVINFLFDNGASPGAVDSNAAKPIEFFDAERTEEMKAYHELYKKWNIREESVQTVTTAVLEGKIRKREFEGFQRILKLKPAILKEKCYYDYYLLHMATIRCLPEFVKLIIETDPSTVNVKDRRSSDTSASAYVSFATDKYPHRSVRDATALHYACLSENLETIELLLKAGANWDLKDNKGRKPEDLINDEAVHETFKKLRDEEEAVRKVKAEEEAARKAEEEAAKKANKPESSDEKSKNKEDSGDSNKSGDSDEESESDSDSDTDRTELKLKQEEEKKNEAIRKAREAAFALEKVLGERVIGQRGPIRTVANAIRLRENGWVDPDRPLVMLFLGSSGVGKTEVAKQVALHMHGKESNSTKQSELVNEMEKKCGFIRLDMSEYQHSHTVSNLTGSPKGYVGYEEGGYLTGRLAKNPKAIVLIDEIEKAHPNVLTVFLQVFDDGRITDPKRGVIYCKDATFIMTSNLASDEIKRKSPYLRRIVAETEAQGRPEEYMRLVGDFNRKIHPILKDALRRDEFLGRINQIVVFLPLDEEEISVVINAELKVWKRRAQEKHGIRLSWSKEAVENLTKSYDVNYGVRSVMHEVQRIAIQLIADAQIRGELHNDWLAYLTTDERGDCVLRSMNSIELIKSKRGCRYYYH